MYFRDVNEYMIRGGILEKKINNSDSLFATGKTHNKTSGVFFSAQDSRKKIICSHVFHMSNAGHSLDYLD